MDKVYVLKIEGEIEKVTTTKTKLIPAISIDFEYMCDVQLLVYVNGDLETTLDLDIIKTPRDEYLISESTLREISKI